MRKLTSAIPLSFVAAAVLIAGLVRDGLAGPLEDLRAQTEAAARRGDPHAQTLLGIMYEKGLGVRPNPVRALEWFRAAANRGDSTGCALVGRAYADGRGVPSDDTQALAWFNRSAQNELREFVRQPIGFAGGTEGALEFAEQGNPLAQIAVAKMYLTGYGVEQNDTEAVRWLSTGTAAGSIGAELLLALMLQEGRGGLPQDTGEAMRLYRKAAEQIAQLTESSVGMVCAALTGRPDCTRGR